LLGKEHAPEEDHANGEAGPKTKAFNLDVPVQEQAQAESGHSKPNIDRDSILDQTELDKNEEMQDEHAAEVKMQIADVEIKIEDKNQENQEPNRTQQMDVHVQDVDAPMSDE